MNKTLTVSLDFELLGNEHARKATMFAIRHIQGVWKVDDALARNGLVYVDVLDDDAIAAVEMISGVRTVRYPEMATRVKILQGAQ